MATHPSPTTLHLHLHPVHAPHSGPWTAVVMTIVALAFVIAVVALSGGGEGLSPDQLPQPRNLTTFAP
ncbi:hypothetical protein [Pedococcus bigeumensis]|uniref:Uncharacterized protein n=1 Tax=Pedococcus bigeumensis TaxID=433644 RepID=A0A502CH86_9MICO|nr:hypothetical protein [Pedococcus bigeumensis]TPG12537.1 hypothetical protein EAH86_19720 [Pedococcus bigeumensis]